MKNDSDKKEELKRRGKANRRKGRTGQREAGKLLERLNYIVIEANGGKISEDFIAINQNNNKTYSVEVKNQKNINIAKFLKQTKAQAKLRKLKNWMLIAKLGKGYGWLILEKNKKSFVAK